MSIKDYGISVDLFIPLNFGLFKFNYKNGSTNFRGFGLCLFLLGISFSLEKDEDYYD